MDGFLHYYRVLEKDTVSPIEGQKGVEDVNRNRG